MISHAGNCIELTLKFTFNSQLATNRTNCIERPVDRAREGRATLLLLLLALFALRTASVGPISRRAPLTTMCTSLTLSTLLKSRTGCGVVCDRVCSVSSLRGLKP